MVYLAHLMLPLVSLSQKSLTGSEISDRRRYEDDQDYNLGFGNPTYLIDKPFL